MHVGEKGTNRSSLQEGVDEYSDCLADVDNLDITVPINSDFCCACRLDSYDTVSRFHM